MDLKETNVVLIDIVGNSAKLMDIMKRPVALSAVMNKTLTGTKATFHAQMEPGHIVLVPESDTKWLVDLVRGTWLDGTLEIETKGPEGAIRNVILAFQGNTMAEANDAMRDLKSILGAEIVPLTGTPIPYDQREAMKADYIKQATAPLVMDHH